MRPICPTCAGPIPNGLLICEVCTRKQNDRAMRIYQYAPLRRIMAGQARLKVRTIDGKRHIQMIGADVTYCGRETNAQQKASWIEWDPAAMTRLCDRCRSILWDIADEARRAA